METLPQIRARHKAERHDLTYRHDRLMRDLRRTQKEEIYQVLLPMAGQPQREVAEKLDISQRAFSALVRASGINWVEERHRKDIKVRTRNPSDPPNPWSDA